MDAIGRIFRPDIFFSPGIEDQTIEYHCQDHIEKHPSKQYKKALQGRFAPEFPGFRFLPDLLFIHGLIDHSGYLAITAQRHPPDPVFRMGILWFEFDQAEPGIEEQVEFINPDLEKRAKRKCPDSCIRIKKKKGPGSPGQFLSILPYNQ